VDGSELSRAVRRRQGLSQRELARAAGVHPRTVAAVEAGSRAPTLAVLQAVAACAGLELVADLPPPEPPDRLLAFLRHSLSRRLELSLGMSYGAHAPTPLWVQLRQLAVVGDVVLHGEAAVALWLPRSEPLGSIQACFARRQPWEVPDTPDVQRVAACDAHARALVAVSIASWTVGVDPPAQLALLPELAAHRPLLRSAARALHQDAARDEAGRRVAAHREPAHAMEQHYVFHTKAFRQRRMPDRDDRRGWRLHDDASLAAWLRRYGYPV
jgi:transcriptional regulator with XRE-family HTH domain